jgi:hypothetical protein
MVSSGVDGVERRKEDDGRMEEGERGDIGQWTIDIMCESPRA